MSKCVYCKREVVTRKHHIVPKSKGGKETVEACKTCEEFIHRTWSHNQLRDLYSTIESVTGDEKYKKFKQWLSKQPLATHFKSKRGKERTKHKYR